MNTYTYSYGNELDPEKVKQDFAELVKEWDKNPATGGGSRAWLESRERETAPDFRGER